ncbi:peptidylprolyl isomerase [Echinicola marina]|uniref:peptidylprolyl isomerase n=1 Tax=Echinicola marina TaxID=2859768 RepID=UPI001CF6A672|nr:peptidylprolyl isomerase [Echinicola marina]UCS94082.1 peptidylprolyl isomerase [Echinicola marina]
MKRFLTTASVLVMSAMMFSCLQEKETEFEKNKKRDDLILSEYIAANGIEATETTAGYYYKKDVENEDGARLNDGDIIGIYYEMESLDGSFIGAHTEEDGDPILFQYDIERQTLAPLAINLAVGLSNVGETLTLYVPSYNAFGDFGYGQLFQAHTNMVIKVTFVKIYPKQEVDAMEDDMINAYIAENELEGFAMKESGVYVKVVEEGDVSTDKSKNGNDVSFTYELFQLGEEDPFSKVESNPISTTLGHTDNMGFLNIGLNDLHKDAEVEVIAPSSQAYEGTAQVIPLEIRDEYFELGYLTSIVKPFEPVLFKAKVTAIN